MARDAAKSQKDLIDSTHEFLSVLAQLPAIRTLDPQLCNEFLDQFLTRYPRYTSITMRAADDATSICRATPKNGPIPSEPGVAHVRVAATKQFAVGDYVIGRTSGKAVLPFGYPILDDSGELQAVLMVALDLDVLNQMAAQALLPAGSTLMVIDGTGKVLVRFPDPEEWMGKSAVDAPAVKDILAHHGEGTVQAPGEDSVPRLYAYTPLTHTPDNNMYMTVGIPSAIAFAEANDTLTKNLIALAVVAVLALGAAWFGGDWFLVRQVNELVTLTRRVAKGDLGARARNQYGVGELGQLARAFDTMGESLEQQEAARKAAEDQTRRWSAELERLMNALSDAVSQSFEVGRIADIALVRTLSMMDLTCGGVFLKRGNTLSLVARTGLCDEITQAVQLAEQASGDGVDPAPTEMVRIISTQSSRQAGDAGEERKSWIRVPIACKDSLLGLICLACDDHRTLRMHEKGVLAAVGQQIGVAIQNADLQEQVQSIAALHERERLSRELHDGLAQVLGYLCIRTDVARELVKSARSDRAIQELSEIQGVVQQAHQDLRESILGLRTTIHPQGGLFSSLKEYLHKFSVQTGIAVNLVSNGTGRIQFSPEAEVQLLRIIQEALANVRKHSGAQQAWIRFELDTDHAAVTIEDNGKGFDPAGIGQSGRASFGLQTMRERAEGAGGSLRISSQPGRGVKIVVELPLQNGGM